MAGEIQLNSVTLATESGGTISLSGDVDTLTPIKTALNASGSAPIYACRAWVNYNATATTIRASGNVSSVTYNDTGRYTVNLTTAMPDANFSCVATGGKSGNRGNSVNVLSMSTTAVAFSDGLDASYGNSDYFNIAIFR